jgi:hypothetical protein
MTSHHRGEMKISDFLDIDVLFAIFIEFLEPLLALLALDFH